MNQNDRAAFQAMLTLVAEQYGKPMSTDLIGFYFDGLSNLTLAQVRAALNAHVRNTDTGQFMPKIADLIRAIEGTHEAQAYAALARIQKDFGGAYCTDPVAIAVVRDMGGWTALGMRQAEEWQSFGAKDFVKRYTLYRSRGDANTPTLIDDFEQKLLDRAQP